MNQQPEESSLACPSGPSGGIATIANTEQSQRFVDDVNRFNSSAATLDRAHRSLQSAWCETDWQTQSIALDVVNTATQAHYSHLVALSKHGQLSSFRWDMIGSGLLDRIPRSPEEYDTRRDEMENVALNAFLETEGRMQSHLLERSRGMTHDIVSSVEPQPQLGTLYTVKSVKCVLSSDDPQDSGVGRILRRMIARLR